MNFKRTILKNGIKLILVPQKESLSTTAMVLVEAGSKYETKNLSGISHFLEHMCFKGTTTRPQTSQIAEELDGLGAQYNAFTTEEYTGYYAKARNESLQKTLAIIADLYMNPIFNPQEIEKEKGVIIEEINMYEDMPARKVQELFMKVVYGNQPAGWGVAGDKIVIRKMKREDFIKYRNVHYVPQATTIIISGGFKEKNLPATVYGIFKNLSEGKKGEKPKVKEAQKKPQELLRHKDSDQTHLVLGFRAFNVFDKRRWALQVLSNVLGGGMSSRLFKKVRDELGAAYYIHSSVDLYSDHGLIAMAAGVDNKKSREVIKAGLKEFDRFKNEKVGEAELKKTKDHLIGNLFLSLETSDQIGSFYGGQEVMGEKLMMPEAIARKIREVTALEIQKVARGIFRSQNLNLAAIGPFKKETFNDILKI